MIQTALSLALRGLSVFPCRPRDKRPATANGVKDATTDLEIIRQWWRRVPDLNVGLATGGVSGIFVIDLDGIDAEAELRRLEQEYGALPPTVESITARGRHSFFRMPQATVRNSAGRIAPGIDVRGDGGYVLVPPSLHPSGRGYVWSVDSADEFATAPDWLLAKVVDSRGTRTAALQSSDWRDLVMKGVAEGRRNTAAARLCGYLLRRHVDPVVALELLRLWNEAHCRPPLPDSEIDRIADSIAGRELQRRLGRAGC
ncbi:bifunctional DNA primase/polymerase [Bradyrhizobium sp. CB1650]|uniref:bifunctional DNA primase/polymerase n=1 Tax=Bradyrhizobium sp. CB1650 TaxID=3039153 RepID=UPI0024349BAC|nr:bifunctional DNA primase/polymerase [Bradyrhizobium sp. CB1650]WGD56065.1 bifunctional DNA primase/polymerase [Bradyrhizobium sp. CB1650]